MTLARPDAAPWLRRAGDGRGVGRSIFGRVLEALLLLDDVVQPISLQNLIAASEDDLVAFQSRLLTTGLHRVAPMFPEVKFHRQVGLIAIITMAEQRARNQ